MLHGKALVIDDCPVAREAARRILEDGGIQAVTLDNVFELQPMLEQEAPDLLLLDVKMPFLDGARTFEIIQRHGLVGQMPVLFFSDLDEEALTEVAEKAGVDGYVTKAAGSRAMVREVRFWLHEARRRRTADSTPDIVPSVAPTSVPSSGAESGEWRMYRPDDGSDGS